MLKSIQILVRRLINPIEFDMNFRIFSGAAQRAFFCLMVLVFTNHVTTAQTYHPEKLQIIDGERSTSFRIELADSPEVRSKGLMFRETMPEDAGMLFCFEEVKPVLMWMKNTILPLDMIFIRADGTISSIEENTVPFSEKIIASKEPILFVLELNAGAVSKFGIKNENRVLHSSILSCTLDAKRVIERSLQ